MARRKAIPPKPECGSIEINKIITAINEGEPNPCTENEKCIEYYNEMLKDKIELTEEYGEEPYFDLVEPDAYEDYLLGELI